MSRSYWSDPGHHPLPWKPLACLWVGVYVVTIVALEAVDRATGRKR